MGGVEFGDERLPERFWAKVQPEPMTGCWLWEASEGGGGYGNILLRRGMTRIAHRIAYLTLVGEVRPGLHLDHLCRVRCCVNPDHLEPVTCRENLMRGDTWAARNAAKTHCKRGHSLEGAYVKRDGERRCRRCHADYEYARKRGLPWG